MNSDPVGVETLKIMAMARHYNRWLFRVIKPHLVGRIAEVGSGTGTFTNMLVDEGHQVTTIDINPEYLSQEVLDLQTKNLPRHLVNKFDTILALNVVEHLQRADQALANFSRLLKTGGKLIVLVPQGQWAYGSLDRSLGHIQRFDLAGLRRVISGAGLKVVLVRSLNFWGVWGWWWNSRIVKRQLLPAWQVKLFDVLAVPWLWLESFISPPLGLSLLAVATK